MLVIIPQCAKFDQATDDETLASSDQRVQTTRQSTAIAEGTSDVLGMLSGELTSEGGGEAVGQLL